MALTINQQPQEYTPSYNEQTIRVSSDETAQPGFRFKVHMEYLDEATLGYVRIYTGYFLPRPGTDEAIIDCHRILENYCRQTLIDKFIERQYGVQSHIGYDFQNVNIFIVEEYGNPRVEYGVESVTYDIWNASLKYQDFVGYDFSDYVTTLNDPKKWLTNGLSNQYIGLTEQASLSWLYDFQNPTDTQLEVELKVYEDDGTLQRTFTIDAPTTSWAGSSAPNMFSLLVGPEDLENTPVLTGTKPIFDASSSYYTIQMLDDNLDPSLELRTYTLKEYCINPMRLHFLNRLGGMDSFTFGLKHKKAVNVERMEINRQGWLYSTAITNLQKEKGFINANINSNETIQLNCNWLKDADVVWLEELITSPEIFLEMNDRLHSVLITNYSNYEIKTQNQDGVFNLSLDLKFAYSSSSQWA